LDKINKKATKVGMPLVVVTKLAERSIPDPNYSGLYPHPMIHVVDFEVNGGIIKLAGWTFLGTLDHYSLPGSVLVHTVPGQSIPETYFHSKPICEHCNKSRRRSETFVVRHESGEEKQVGRQCLAEFLGIDPHRAISYLQSMIETVGTLDEEGYSGGSYKDYYHDLDTVLALTLAVISKDGWVSKKMAEERMIQPTSATVDTLLSKPYGMTEEEWRDMRKEYATTQSMLNDVPLIRDWVKNQTGSNEYMHNLQTIETAGEVSWWLLGYACSMASSYQRAMNTFRLTQPANILNEWYGSEHGKVEVTIKVVSTQAMHGYYGLTTLFTMKDNDGRRFKWFASGEGNEMEVDKTYTIRGTVKKHDEYNGIKDTVLTRVKIKE
jgi:hypothetical protein